MSATEGLHTSRNFRLHSGMVLPEATIAYVTQGRLRDGGRNAVLLTHGYTSSHRFALGEAGASEGSWGALVGPGKAIDTDRFYVISANMLGSSYGSTGPGSHDPSKGRPYGPDFPDITLSDIVAQQHDLLRHLGVTRLLAVVGPSFGGFQAFQWAVDFPDAMDAIVPVVTAPHSPATLGEGLEELVGFFAKDPSWNNGHHYGGVGVIGLMKKLRVTTLKGYGLEADLAERYPEPDAREAEIERIAEAWARVFDPNSLITLRKASMRFDVRPSFPQIRARVLYVLSRTDTLFPPSLAESVMQGFRGAGVRADYAEIDSDRGHLASGLDAAKWADRLGAFLSG